jgi:hypothetical protein
MARKAIRKQADTGGPKQSNRTMLILWVSGAVVGILIYAMPTVLLLLVGMLPSMVAFITDRSDEKYSTFCVAAMNFAGVFPYMLELWFLGHTIDASVQLITNVFALFVMYGAAGFGWAIFSSITPVVSTILSTFHTARIASLRTTQRTLIGEWGEAVAHKDTPPEVAAVVPTSTPTRA